MLSAAEKTSGKLGGQSGPEYARWLAETVGLLKPHEESRGILEALATLNVPIATTNYDSLLEGACGLSAVTWKERGRVERILHGDDKAILHLHGYWSDPTSVVPGIRSYEQGWSTTALERLRYRFRYTHPFGFFAADYGKLRSAMDLGRIQITLD